LTFQVAMRMAAVCLARGDGERADEAGKRRLRLDAAARPAPEPRLRRPKGEKK
jgi:hypothetical protein